MNTAQLHAIATEVLPRGSFFGVFAADRIPELLLPGPGSSPRSLIVNTDPSALSGSHWVLYFIRADGNLEFFDSYGRNPSDYGLGPRPQIWNRRQIQSEFSDVCGQYCIYFLYKRHKNIPFEDVVSLLAKCAPKESDSAVRRYVRTMLSRITISPHAILNTWPNQNCCSRLLSSSHSQL